jgi:hypothetical protein
MFDFCSVHNPSFSLATLCTYQCGIGRAFPLSIIKLATTCHAHDCHAHDCHCCCSRTNPTACPAQIILDNSQTSTPRERERLIELTETENEVDNHSVDLHISIYMRCYKLMISLEWCRSICASSIYSQSSLTLNMTNFCQHKSVPVSVRVLAGIAVLGSKTCNFLNSYYTYVKSQIPTSIQAWFTGDGLLVISLIDWICETKKLIVYMMLNIDSCIPNIPP